MPNEEVKPWKIIDYIDRYKVLELLDNRADWFSEPPMDKDDFTKLKLVIELALEIRKLPTIDAKEVKHGEWIKHFDDLFPVESTQECSICHEEEFMNLCNDKYCPNCGAKMDGGKANDL